MKTIGNHRKLAFGALAAAAALSVPYLAYANDQGQHAQAQGSSMHQSGGSMQSGNSQSGTGMRQTGNRQSSGQSSGSSGAGNPGNGTGILVGELVDSRNVAIKGSNVQHRILKLRGRDGQDLFVNIGANPMNSVTSALDRGDRVIAIGKMARLNDRPVFYARQIGELQSVGRSGMRSTTSSRQASATPAANRSSAE